MEQREPWLLVQEGSKIYLLARDHQAFYLIAVNKKLTAEAEEQLERCGSITKTRLTEMGLTFREIPRNQVRGVALTGSEAGECLYFCVTSGKKQKYVFSDDYDRAQTDAFFAGLERFTAPGKKKKKDPQDWRTGRQDPALYDKLGWLPVILLALNIGVIVGYVRNQTWPWYLAYLVCLLIPVVLDMVMPAYFTLITEKGSSKNAIDLSMPLWILILVLLFMTRSNWLDETLFLKLWVICGILSVAVAYLLAEEFRRQKAALLPVLFVAGAVMVFAISHTNRVFDFSQPQSHVLAVEDLERSRSSKTTSYECTVTLPDGRTVDIEISGRFYNTLEIGDEVLVEVSPGALGIEYVSVYPVE